MSCELNDDPLDRSIHSFGHWLTRYRQIVVYKTAFYTFYLPAACAMHLNGIADHKCYQIAKDVCIQMGEYFQVQDDYLDCYGDPEVIGKVGTDIQDNKCSWLVVQALSRVSPEQREVLKVRLLMVFHPEILEWLNGWKSLFISFIMERPRWTRFQPSKHYITN